MLAGFGESEERGRSVICWRRPVGTILDPLRTVTVTGGRGGKKSHMTQVSY